MSMDQQQMDFRVIQTPQRSEVWIDGEEMTSRLSGVEIFMDGRQPPAVKLHTIPGTVLAEGKGYIYVQSRIDGAVLDDLVPEEIERLAMEKEQWGSDKTLVENIIEVIKERLSA